MQHIQSALQNKTYDLKLRQYNFYTYPLRRLDKNETENIFYDKTRIHYY